MKWYARGRYFTSGAASGHHVGPQGGRVFPPDDAWRPSLGPMSVDEEVDALAAYLRTQSEADYLHMKGADIQINRDPITWDMTWDDINVCEPPRHEPHCSHSRAPARPTLFALDAVFFPVHCGGPSCCRPCCAPSCPNDLGLPRRMRRL